MKKLKAGDRVYDLSKQKVGVITELAGANLISISYEDGLSDLSISDKDIRLLESPIALIPVDSEVHHVAITKVNLKPKGGKYVEIWVYGGEGPEPHFHVYQENQTQDKSGGVCICICKNGYFNHAGHTGSLDKKHFDAMVRSLPDIWDSIIDAWNSGCEDGKEKYKIPTDTPIPDYTYPLKKYNEISNGVIAHG